MQHWNSDTRCRILVIDDNPAIHDDFNKILSGIGDDAGFTQTTGLETPLLRQCHVT
jgi:CheY-like chemotaxis protein